MKKRQGVIERINYADVIIVFILIIFTLLALYPFVYTIAGSFNDGIDYEYGGIWLFPRKFTLANYITVFTDARLYKAFFNTVIATVAGVAGGLVFTSCVAYAMSHPKLKFHKVFWVINMITMFFGGGLIPYFMLIKGIGLYNSFLVYIIPSLYSVYNMIVLTNFFRGIDNSMRESAMLDGANEFRIWWSLYMPVSMPALATVGLWLTVGHWNSYMPTLIYTKKDESIWLLQFYLMKIIKDTNLPDADPSISSEISAKTISFAAIVISSLPIFLVYPFVAKYFTKGVMIGAVKG